MAAYDYIIIGSGINALVAAAMLSGKGRRVVVLERSDVLGGCMRTDEATLPGFQHDVLATTFVLFVTSPAYGELGKDLARHGLAFCNTSLPAAVLRPAGSPLLLSWALARPVPPCHALPPGARAPGGRGGCCGGSFVM